MKLERDFQPQVIKAVKERLPGARVLKNDANYLQGYPDLSVLKNGRYALLECKRSENEPHQPNQDHYIEEANRDGGYGAFVHPKNLEEVLDELERRLK